MNKGRKDERKKKEKGEGMKEGEMRAIKII